MSVDPIAAALDGAIDDWWCSATAMRWVPARADDPDHWVWVSPWAAAHADN